MFARVGMVALPLMGLCAGALLRAQEPAPDAAPYFIVSGTSTVRAWSCPAQGILKVTLGKASHPVRGFPNGVQTVVMTLPVKAIACEDATMVEHLREAMKEKAYPEIVYRLTQYTLTGSDTAQVTGTLTIAGVTKPITLDVKLTPSPPGVRVVGDTSLDMTQFALTPPVIWRGLLKVGKDVRIRFDAVVQASQLSQ